MIGQSQVRKTARSGGAPAIVRAQRRQEAQRVSGLAVGASEGKLAKLASGKAELGDQVREVGLSKYINTLRVMGNGKQASHYQERVNQS